MTVVNIIHDVHVLAVRHSRVAPFIQKLKLGKLFRRLKRERQSSKRMFSVEIHIHADAVLVVTSGWEFWSYYIKLGY
jgi:hypothetical protein